MSQPGDPAGRRAGALTLHVKENPAPRRTLRLLLVGVGGQGVLTAARFIGEAAFSENLPVVVGQLHGMSQRGGSVQSSVVIGSGRSSFIGRGEADVILGLEPLEVLRARPEMSGSTRVLINMVAIVPSPSTRDGIDYPDRGRILERIRAVAPDVIEIDGAAIVSSTGEPRTLNIAMLGALAGLRILPFDAGTLWKAIEKGCPERYLEPNRRAFTLGRGAVEK